MSDPLIDTTSPLVRQHFRHFLDKIADRLGKTTFLISEAWRSERPLLRWIALKLGAAAGFSTFMATFNGVDNYLHATDAVIGIADSKTFDLSFWMHPKGDGTERVILANDDGAAGAAGIRVYLDTGNRLNVQCRNSIGTLIFHDQSLSNGYIDAMGVCNVHVFGDLLTGTTGMLWNGFDDSNIQTAAVNDTIHYTKGQWTIGADGDGSQPFNGNLGEMFGKFDVTPKDYSMATGDANHALFVTDADLRPVSLGADGEVPYSANADIYWKGDTTSAATISANGTTPSVWTENQPLGSSGVTPGNFVFRLPETDFPDTAAEYLGTNTQIAAVDGPVFSGICHMNHDVNGTSDRVMSIGELSFEMTGSGTPASNDAEIIGTNYDWQDADAQWALQVNHQWGVRVDTDATANHTVDVDGADVTSGITITTLNEGVNLDLNTALPTRIGNSNSGTARYWDGGIGGVAVDAADTLSQTLSDRWDAANAVPTWPGRKCENWFSAQPALWCLLPGSGFRRSRGTVISADLTEFGVSQPLLPRATWFAP